MLNGFAVPSSSSWSSPCLLDVKSDGSLRFCIGFHRVNAITVPDAHPLPRIDDCIDEIGPAKYVSKLNILKGYWPWLCNAPATFKRLNKVLGDVSNCKVYLDDIVVYWDDWASHMTTLREVICTYLPHHLRWTLLNLSFGRVVLYLGQQVGQGQRCPANVKTTAIAEFAVPSTRKELHHFLGMAGYYCSYLAKKCPLWQLHWLL